MRPLAVALVFLSAVGVLIGVSLAENTIPVLQLHELRARASGTEGDAGKGEAAGGNVIIDGSRIVAIRSAYPLVFDIAPAGAEDAPLRVESDTSPPENFKVGNPVRVWGALDRQANVFRAYQVTTQCPSRYKATEEAKKAMEIRSVREGLPEAPLGAGPLSEGTAP